MFTGLIELVGTIKKREIIASGLRLEVDAPFISLSSGESISVNGVCLTLLPQFIPYLCFELSKETLEVTTLSSLTVGDKVNLERSLLPHTRMGGHFVLGHIDSVSTIQSITHYGEFIELVIGDFLQKELPYLVHKGCIAVEGISLTINEISSNKVRLMLVPHTLAHTNLSQKQVGDRVNIEFDYLSRIIAHQHACRLCEEG